ncbi:MAG: LptF/LptG family permease [Planctomycetota bacterium]
MPRILSRHIVADLCRILFLTTAVLVSVIAFGAAIRPIMQNLLGADDLLQYVGLASVPMLQFALPFSGAFAGTIVYARLTGDNEILAMSAAGISYRRILLPAAALGVVMLLGMAVLVDVGVPRFWTSMRLLVTRDPTKLFIAAVERGEAFVVPGTGTQLYADEARIVEVEEADGAPATRLALAGVAAIELDGSGRPATEFTAEAATVDIYRKGDSAYLKLLFRNATAFREGEDALVFVPVAEPEAIDLGKGIRLSPKDYDLRGLLAILDDVGSYHEVADARRDLAASLDAVDRWRCVADALGPAGSGNLRFSDAGGRRIYEVRNATLEGTTLRPRRGATLELIELERGTATRRAAVAEATLAPEKRARVDGERLELLARPDTVADLRGLGGGGRWPPRIGGLRPEDCAVTARGEGSIDALAAEAAALSDGAAGAPPSLSAATQAARGAAKRLAREIHEVRADAIARIVQRANQALCAPLMLLLGAVLAIRLRGANPLRIYLLAFIPSIIDILLISGGEQMLKESTSALGVFVTTSGNLGIALAILIAYRQVARN